MEFLVEAGGIPAGTYRATFMGCAAYDKNPEYGPGCELSWRVNGGQYNGATVTRVCSAKLSSKSALSRFASALAGAPLQPGTRFNFATYSGVAGVLLVESTESGSSRASGFIPDATEVEKF